MIREFQIQNFFSIRERQTLSFLPTNDDKMRSQYLYEVAEGVELLKIGIVYGSNTSGKTTHDINLLNEDYIRRDVVWFTDKSREGATQLKRLSSLGLHKTMNPYHAYKQGKLVDLPFLGSIYLDKED